MEILRRFVDEWLGSYVEGNGSISPEEVNMCVQTMDERFDALLDDLQRKQYRIWRDDTAGDHNKLRFWKLRFAPTAVGRWTWKTVCSDTTNAALHAQSGELQCVAYAGEPRATTTVALAARIISLPLCAQ